MKQTGPNFAEQRIIQRKKTARVWKLLEETGIKRRYIAKHLGVSYGYLNQVQYGQRLSVARCARRFLNFLGLKKEDSSRTSMSI
jgi:hypothetical protein